MSIETLMRSKGYLASFINDETRKYVEPTRKGTAKGDKIGFSRTKHLASLLCLTSISLKDISTNIDVSYGLLRLWRTEKDFMSQIRKNEVKFLSYLYENINNTLSSLPQVENEKYITPLVEEDFKGNFDDISCYDNELVFLITNMLFDTQKKKLKDRNIFKLKYYFLLISKIIENSSTDQESKNDISHCFVRGFTKFILADVKNIIENNELKKEKSYVFECLELVTSKL